MGAAIVGEIVLKSPTVAQWEILDFFSLLEEWNCKTESPTFHCMGATWCLGFYGRSLNDIQVYLKKIHSESKLDITYRLGINDKDGREFMSEVLKDEFSNDSYESDKLLCIPVEDLLRLTHSFVEPDRITLFCVLSPPSPYGS